MARPIGVLSIAIFAAILGVIAALSLGAGPAASDPELTLLIRFMAVLKAGMAMAGAALAAWRLGYPASTRLAGGYAGAVALMAAAPGLIWEMSHIIAGAAMFHAGLAIFLVCAWADRGLATEMFARRAASRTHFHSSPARFRNGMGDGIKASGARIVSPPLAGLGREANQAGGGVG